MVAVSGSSTGWSRPAPAEARTLAQACLFAALVCLGNAAAPFSPTAPTGLAVTLGSVGLAISALVRWRSEHVPTPVLHTVLALVTVMVSVCIACSTTPAGTVVTAFGYVWIALFTAWFHSRRATLAHLAVMGGGFAAGLGVCDAPSALQTWGFVAVSVGGVALVLQSLVERLRRQADRDQLTGLLNRVAFAAAAERVMHTAARNAEPLTLAVLDLDDFKGVNDRDGHAVGDRVLAGLATAWSGAVRRTDVLGRYGGDEFVLLMPGITEDGSGEVLQRLRDALPDARWTAGVAQWRGEDLSRWLVRADADLYAHKRSRVRDVRSVPAPASADAAGGPVLAPRG
ncbi:GGDEF domain-containing protein [Motilibacter deserti]|uniref:GGDEF domain-containing protein n=1 Tax=Motilibacter deserti TaxID=2714956 RepID=A0ABX0GTM5_9ACTN|nr:GGDEF domain-containing protein [Motilibacter deserti]NHC13491.1 GGDEF domain-containing protein [Motilibacter deserti]